MTPDRRTCPICNGTGRQILETKFANFSFMCICRLETIQSIVNSPPKELKTSKGLLGYLRDMANKSDPTIWNPRTKTTPIPDRGSVSDEITDTTLEDLGF